MRSGLTFGDPAGALEIRAAWNGTARIVGRFPYNTRAILGVAGVRRREERFAPHAFEARILDPQADIYLLAGHDYDRPLASRAAGSLSIEDRADGVSFEAELSGDILETTHGRDALALLRSRLATGLSPGFRVAPDGEEVAQERGGALRTITRAELFELSIVTAPAYPQARAEARARDFPNSPHAGLSRTLRRWR